MNLQGGQRGGARDLALHLLKDENEHVSIHDLRGFISDDLVSALNEAYAISRGTKAKQFLFSVSLNPPPQEKVTVADFEAAVARVEEHFGLNHQPRAIVFHEKQGRRHAHAVWSRIDAKTMKAIALPFTKRGLRELSRELYLQHGWKMPEGYMNSAQRDPMNFTMAQWQQAKRSGKDPRDVKSVLQDCWAVSDTQSAFTQSLKDRGYTLARGDRRGFVAIDHKCNIFSISKKWIGIATKDVRSKLNQPDTLPSVNTAKVQIARSMAENLKNIINQNDEIIQSRQSDLEEKRRSLVHQQLKERQEQSEQHSQRSINENLLRQQRFSKGWRRLFDWASGNSKKIKQRNEVETREAQERDNNERDELIFSHLTQRQKLQIRIERLQSFNRKRQSAVNLDIKQYREIAEQRRECFENSMSSKSIRDFER